MYNIVDVKVKGVSKKRIILDHTFGEEETYKIFDKGTFSLIIYKKPVEVTGMSSMCKDGSHVLFLDYDNVCKWIVEDDCKRLIDVHGFTPFYLLTTQEKKVDGVLVGHYSAISITKCETGSIPRYQRETHCDNAYITMPLRNRFRSWVLRTSQKGKRTVPEFLGVIGDINKEYDNPVSSPHLSLLKKIAKSQGIILPNIKYKYADGSRTLYKNIYETRSRIE